MFYISIFVLAIALLFGVYTGGQQQWFTSVPSFAGEIVSFLGVSMSIIYYFLTKRLGSPSFTQAYLVSISLKMLGYSAFVLTIIFMDRAGAVANVIFFMLSYILFTAVEVGFLFRAVNK